MALIDVCPQQCAAVSPAPVSCRELCWPAGELLPGFVPSLQPKFCGLCAVHVLFLSSYCWDWRTPGCQVRGAFLGAGIITWVQSVLGIPVGPILFIWELQEILIFYSWGHIWITLTGHTILATSVHHIFHLGLGKSGIRFPGISRICIEQVDSDKHAWGIKCSLSLYLLQNQENKPVIPEGIKGEFSWLFPTLPDTGIFRVEFRYFVVNTAAFLYWKSAQPRHL